MKDTLYHSMDAPMAPIERKVEGLKPAEKAFFVMDLCVDCVAPSLDLTRHCTDCLCTCVRASAGSWAHSSSWLRTLRT